MSKIERRIKIPIISLYVINEIGDVIIFAIKYKMKNLIRILFDGSLFINLINNALIIIIQIVLDNNPAKMNVGHDNDFNDSNGRMKYKKDAISAFIIPVRIPAEIPNL